MGDKIEKNDVGWHVAHMWDRRGVLVGKPERRDHLEDPGIDGRIILRWIFRKLDVGILDWIELAQDR